MHERHTPAPSVALRQRQKRLTAALLLVWMLASFGPAFVTHELDFEVLGSPFHFWMAAQGSILVFIAIVVIYAALMNHWEAQAAQEASSCEDHTPV